MGEGLQEHTEQHVIQTGNCGQGRRGIISTASTPVKQNKCEAKQEGVRGKSRQEEVGRESECVWESAGHTASLTGV